MSINHHKYNPSDFEPIKRIALTFPGAAESVSHENTPSIKVRNKLMCRLHDNGEFIPIRIEFDFHEYYLEKYPDIFHIPEHFKGYPYLCMWIHNYDTGLLKEILELSWKSLASKKQLMEWEKSK